MCDGQEVGTRESETALAITSQVVDAQGMSAQQNRFLGVLARADDCFFRGRGGAGRFEAAEKRHRG